MAGVLGAATGFVFVAIVVPIWIVAHYLTKWRTAKALNPEDEGRFAELHALAMRLEQRMATIERILDADRPADARTRQGA
jgi:phage shock protein B